MLEQWKGKIRTGLHDDKAVLDTQVLIHNLPDLIELLYQKYNELIKDVIKEEEVLAARHKRFGERAPTPALTKMVSGLPLEHKKRDPAYPFFGRR